MSARFLLEFEATGDQEVVNAINQVSEAGKQAATDLEGLQNIEDPFTAITSGAEGAVTPLEDIGGATEGLTGIFAEAGTSSEEFGGALTSMNDSALAVEGGLTDANTAVGDFGTAATGAGTSATDAMGGIGQMSGAIVGLGGTIGTAISTIFRMQDAQLALDKANLKSTRSTESARKASVAFDSLLKSATSNTEGITAARNELASAQDALNQLQEAGITSGAEYEAAQARVASATSALRGEFVQGGGDANKFDAALNKVSISQEAMSIAAQNLEKATRQYGQTQLETGLAVAGFVGTAVQAVSSLKNMKEGAQKLAPLFTAVSAAIKPIAGVLGGMAIGFTAFLGIMSAIDKNVGGVKDALKGVHDQANQTVPALSGLFDHLGKTFETNTKGFGAWGEELRKMLGIPAAEGPKAAAGLKGTADASTELGTASADMGAKLKGAMEAANGNTTAIGALQRTHADLQMNIDRSGTSLDDFQQIMHTAKSEMDGGATSTDTFNSALDAVNAGMGRTTEEAVKLSNVFPEMGANIKNALLGQEQNMAIAVELWENFRARVEAGQYQVGEFGKFIKDMGYELTAGVQAAVEQITEMSAAAEAVTVSSKGATAGVKMLGTASVDLSSTVGKTANAARDMNKALVEQSYSLQASIIGLRDMENQSQGVSNALLEVTNNFEKSNQSLREAQAVRASATAQSELLHTALNKETESLINEEAALKASIAATQEDSIQTLRLSNAKLEGTKAAMEFISSLDEEKASQEANIAVLRQSVDAMGQFGDTSLLTADQLQHLAEVAAGVPSAIRALAGEIGSLAQEANKFIEFSDEGNELFANWEVSDKIPNEIRAMMSDSDIAFIHGRAQLERTMESLGPLTGVKFAKAIQTAKQGGLAELRNFGPEAAALLREGFPTMDAALSELTNSFAALGTATDAEMIPAMARVVTAMQNVEDPTAALTQKMIELQQQTGASAAPILNMAGGLEQLSAAGASATVKLSEIPLVKITDDAGNAVAEFANFNGQLVPIGPAAQGAATGLGAVTNAVNPLNSAIQLAGTTIQQFSDYVVKAFTQDIPNAVNNAQNMKNPLEGMITVAIASVDQLVTSVNEKISGIKPTVTTNPLTGMISAAMASASQLVSSVNEKIAVIGKGVMPKIQLDISRAIQQVASLKQQIGGVKAAPIVINVSFKIIGKPPVAKEIKGFISYAYRITNKIPNPPEIKRFISYAYRITNKIPNPPEIKRWISYKYRTVGSKPNPQNISRTITYRYRTVGSRPAQTGMHETLGEDTMIAAHKGERVDISPNAGGKENVVTGGFGGGGGGKIIEIISITQLDGKVLTRNVKRHLMEDVGGVA